MKKIELNIKEIDLPVIKKESKKGISAKIRDKALVLYMRYMGKTENEIVARTGLAVSTIVKYIKKYNETGIISIYTTEHKGQPSELNNHTEIIIEDFTKNPPSTIEEAIIRIEALTDIKRTETSVTLFLKKTGFHTKKQEAYQQKRTKQNKKNL